ncbi:hypothetical protein HW555_009638 [Spodoptera exigua]|uniref:Uncharacterized protein n=1 Tax=Spodoptera exigua TaxID=7107 RepID=A0A835GAS3_SPOEX|nr:hypothetical protein HW555_009638 [Spodoptera exigua]
MKTYLAVTLLVAVVTAGVTTNERDLAEVPEDKKVHLSDFIGREGLYVPDSPENTDLDVRDFEIKEEEDEETNLATTRNNLSLGSFGSNDRLMSRITHNVAAASLLIHDQEITFRGVKGTNITAIRVSQVGSNSPTATRIAGGLGSEFVTIRIRNLKKV